VREEVELLFDCKPNVANGFGGSINMGLIEGAYRRLLDLQNFQLEVPGAMSYLDFFAEALDARGIKTIFYEDQIRHIYKCSREKRPYEMDKIYGKTTALFFALKDKRKQLQNIFTVAFFGFEDDYVLPFCKILMQELLFDEHQIQIGLGSSCRNDNQNSYTQNSVL
jgi:hypothetical protein